MKKDLQHYLLICFSVFLWCGNLLQAQDNLQVEFLDLTTVPDFLNICGDPDSEVVLVSVDGLDPNVRSNIVATANLFEGVQFVSFDAANSSPGVTPIDLTDLSRPVFTLPDLDPFGTSSVNIAFSIAANCAYTDTLTINNAAEVYDRWDFSYDLGPTTGLTESDDNIEYRDAFAIPSFTLSVDNSVDAARVGQCYTRDVISANTGLDGFVDTILYFNEQGPGIYVQTVTVNGLPIDVTKTLTVGGDTLISAVIDAGFFAQNTVGTGGLGDGDGFFDPNEVLTITETVCILDCFDDRTSEHAIEWGCFNRYCTRTEVTDFGDVGQGAANPVFSETGSLPDQNTGYCQDGNSTITFTNDGIEVDPGFATMMDVSTGIGLGGTFDLSDGGYEITGIRIAGVDIATLASFVDLNDNPQFTVDPDGAGGLTDFDGDGFFDDLPQNESIEVTVFYSFDCSMAQELGDDETCSNNFSTFFNARIDHTNACQERLVRLETSYFRPSNTRTAVENFTTPDAFAELDTFYVTHTESRSVRNFAKNCSDDEVFYVTVVLPTGVNLVPGVTELLRDPVTSYPLLTNTVSNDTLYLTFDGSVSSSMTGDYTLQLAFQAECSATIGPTNFPIQFGHYCPDCDCRHLWYCGDLQGPQLHSTNPPCPDVPCPVGLRTTSFDVNRTTFGFTDDTYTTPVNPNDVDRKVAISCDSIEMRILNVVGDTPLIDSVGMQITYNNVDETLDSTETFLFDYATVRFYSGGMDHFCTVDTSVLTVTIQDSIKYLNFDLDSCVTALGLTLQPGDTVEFVGNFTLNPNGPYPVQFMKVPNLRGYGYAMYDGVEEACDNFGDVFTIARNQTVFDFPNTSSFPQGCEDTYLQFRLITINNGFDEWFPNEYRQAIGIDSITFFFDTAILDAFSIVEAEVAIPNHPYHGSAFFPMPGFENFPNGHYIARFDTLVQVPALNNVLTNSFNFRVHLVPNCKSLTASSNNDNRFDLDPAIYYRDRYYASIIGDGSCSEVVADSVNNDIYYLDPPTFNYTNVSDPNYVLYGDTAEWIVQHCNTSFVSDAGLTWLAVEDPLGVIEVVEIEDISDPGNVTSLPITAYGSANENYFAFAPGVAKADGSALISDVCNTLRIRALVNQCGTTNFTTRVGWNCVMYTEPDWTPELYPPCDDLLLPLSVTTQDPFLDANIIEQPTTSPNICDTSTIAIIVKNTGQGTAFDVTTQITLPFEGIEIVPGSVEFAYPSDAPYVSIPTDPTFVGTDTRGRIFQYDDFSLLNSLLDVEGLPGYSPSYGEDTTQFVIRYRFVTDCDYQSGSISYYSFQGLKGCGDSTNFETGETLPIFINGADPGLSKIFEVSFADNTSLVPGSANTLEITAENLTTTPTDTTDKILLRIPLDFIYDVGSTTLIEPPSWVLTEPTIDTVMGYQNLYWCLPAGLGQNDSVSLSLTVNTPNFACSVDTTQIGLFTVLLQDLNCAATGTDCSVEAVTSSNNGQLTSIAVAQQNLELAFNPLASTCTAGNQELIIASGDIVNTGQDFPASPITIRYYFDVDGDSLITTADTELANFTENGPIASGNNLSFNHQFTADPSQACQLMALIDTTGLTLCGDAMTYLSEPQLLNAGADQLFCEATPTTITTELGDADCNSLAAYSYNWLAIPPASTTDLSATNVPNPTLTIPHNAVTEDTLLYVLETTRPACTGITRDTVRIIRGVAFTYDLGTTVYLPNGGSTTLSGTLTGGVGPFTYSWATDPTLNDLTSADPVATPVLDTTLYSVTVTSAVGCTATDDILVILGSPIVGEVNPSDTIVCPDETVQLVASGGTDYEWLEDAGNPSTGNLDAYNIANPTFSNGLANSLYTYQVVVTDVGVPGFSDTVEVNIQVNDVPILNIIASPGLATCPGETVTLQGFGATDYEWTNLNTGLVVSNSDVLVDAPTVTTTYLLTGSDPAPACSNTAQITINVLGLTLNASASSNLVCPGDTVTLSGSGAAQLDWYDSGVLVGSGTSIEVTPIAPTTYTLVGENSSNCIDSTTVFVDTYPAPGIVVALEDTAVCAPGTFPQIVELDQTIQSYSIGGNGVTANEVLNGNTLTFDAIYTSDTATFIVTLVGANDGCAIEESFQILPCACSGPNLVSVAVTETTCGNNEGQIVIHLDEPTADYAYTWTPDTGISNDDGNARAGLAAGLYQILIFDPTAPNCNTTVTAIVNNSNGPQAIASTTAATCSSADGTAIITPGNFEYTWMDGSNLAARNDLAAGIYYVTVVDPADPDCENILSIEVGEDNPLEVTATVDVQPDCGLANGTVTLNVIGGSGAYNFSWPSGAATQTNLSSGVYTVTITDTGSGGCSTAFTFALTDNVPAANISITDTMHVTCAGLDNGSIDFDINFAPGFSFPADTLITDGSSDFDNGDLPPGDYCLLIRDANNCLAGEACFTIGEPDSLLLWYTLSPDCEDGGTIDLEVLGGIGPFEIDWGHLIGSANPEDLDELAAGTYTVTVTDDNGCTLADFTEVEACPCDAPTLNSIMVIEATCGNADGFATVHLQEDDGGYQFVWTPDVGTPNTIGNGRSNLPFGGYVVEVIDTLNPSCTLEVYVLVTNSDGPTADAATTPATCTAADGTATLSPAGFDYTWPSPPHTNFRDELAGGIYFVTLTDPTDPDCPNVMMIEIEEESPLTATLQVDQAPDCGVTNGTVTINVADGSGDYTYNWADGLSTIDNQRTNLGAGVYQVTIVDNGPTACTLEFVFVLIDNIGTATVSITDTSHVSCAGTATGGVDFTVNYDPAFVQPADTVITDGLFEYENGALPVGDYCMYILDGNNCFAAAACFTIEEPEAMDFYFVIVPNCEDEMGSIDLSVNGGTPPFTYDWADVEGNTNDEDRAGLEPGNYGVTVTDALNCMLVEEDVLVPSCVDSCEYFGGLDSLTLLANNCSGFAQFCFSVPLQEVQQYEIFDNGLPYTGNLTGCDFDSLIAYAYSELFGQGDLGPYEVVSWSVNGEVFSGEFSDIPALIDSLNTWDPNGNWMTASIGQFITGGASNTTYSALVIEAIDFGTTSTLGINFSAVPNGFSIQLDTGYHEVVIINSTINCSDTLIAMVTCSNSDNICVNETVTFCVDTAALDIVGPVSSITSICTDLADGSVDFVIDAENFCINYTGLNFGTDTTCVEFCDELGNCEVVELYITVDSCFDSQLNLVKDTVFINQTVVYCLDTITLPGNPTFVDNYCADLSGDFVDYFIDPYTYCVEYTGLEIGVDTACVVVCDDLGLCDTTLFCVAVMEYFDPPVTNVDSTCTDIGTPVVIDITANDTLFGGVDSLYILEPPIWGTATINLDGSATYNASDEFCERTDSFTYVGCTPNGCDTTTVFVCIECIDIVIFNAVSANKDGVNDVFFISGIREFPESRLRIFNRWGNLVYETIGYENNWGGTYNGNKDLPDGTYYYLLELNDEAERVFNGYLELYR